MFRDVGQNSCGRAERDGRMAIARPHGNNRIVTLYYIALYIAVGDCGCSELVCELLSLDGSCKCQKD